MRAFRSTLARHSFLYSAGVMIENLGALAMGFFVARVLGPSVQGIWQTARLFATYADLATLGHLFGMRREVAVALGAENTAEVVRQRDSGFIWSVSAMFLAAFMIVLYALLGNLNPLLERAVFAVAVVVAIRGFTCFLTFWHKSTEGFGILALASTISGIVSLITVGLIFWMEFDGLLVGYVLTAAVVALILLAGLNTVPAIRFHALAWLKAFRVGFPLFLVTLSAMLFATLDRLVVLLLMGFANLGFYSISTMFFLPVQVATSSVSVVLLPRACRQYGGDGSAVELARYFLEPLSVLMIGLAGVSATLALLIPVIVDLLLPAYHTGILPAQILLMGLPYSCAPGFCENVLQAVNRTWRQAIISFCASLCKLAFVFVFWALGFRLSGIAAASALGFVAHFILLVAVTGRVTHSHWLSCVRVLGEAALASIICTWMWWYVRDIRTIWQGEFFSWPKLLTVAALAILPLVISVFRMHVIARK